MMYYTVYIHYVDTHYVHDVDTCYCLHDMLTHHVHMMVCMLPLVIVSALHYIHVYVVMHVESKEQ